MPLLLFFFFLGGKHAPADCASWLLFFTITLTLLVHLWLFLSQFWPCILVRAYILCIYSLARRWLSQMIQLHLWRHWAPLTPFGYRLYDNEKQEVVEPSGDDTDGACGIRGFESQIGMFDSASGSSDKTTTTTTTTKSSRVCCWRCPR